MVDGPQEMTIVADWANTQQLILFSRAPLGNVAWAHADKERYRWLQ